MKRWQVIAEVCAALERLFPAVTEYTKDVTVEDEDDIEDTVSAVLSRLHRDEVKHGEVEP